MLTWTVDLEAERSAGMAVGRMAAGRKGAAGGTIAGRIVALPGTEERRCQMREHSRTCRRAEPISTSVGALES